VTYSGGSRGAGERSVDLNPVVIGVGDINVVGSIHRDAGRVAELAHSTACTAPSRVTARRSSARILDGENPPRGSYTAAEALEGMRCGT
jgi:hypothetical protein